jgi:hypothetical protein
MYPRLVNKKFKNAEKIKNFRITPIIACFYFRKKSKIKPPNIILVKQGGRMNRKVLAIFGVLVLIGALSSCSSNPEKNLLDRYFNALSLKDAQTYSSIAIAPATFDFASWEIITVSEAVIEEFKLAELGAKEADMKKQREESIGVTMDARDALDEAIFERNNARSRTARAAAQKKVDELQEAYDTQRDAHDQLQKDYNQAVEDAANEEKIASFSLGADFPNIREFVGEVTFKDVDISVTMKDGTTSNYKVKLRHYLLQDESVNLPHRGRWIIVRFETR